MYSVRIPPEVSASPFSTAVTCLEEQPRKARAIKVVPSIPFAGISDVLLKALLRIPNFFGRMLNYLTTFGVDCRALFGGAARQPALTYRNPLFAIPIRLIES
jgi:hypothetical protein